MKLTKIALGISLGLGGLMANAADVAMFPQITNSNSVSTVVTVVDRGSETTTSRYDIAGKPSLSGNYLHWRLNYKLGTQTTGPSNSDPCKKIEGYLPTTPKDILTVDLGAHLSGTSSGGAMFNDTTPGNDDYSLAAKVSKLPLRGVLFIHNGGNQNIGMKTADYLAGSSADYSATSTVQSTVLGESMVFEYQSGVAWGYSAETKSGGPADDASAFSFADRATGLNGMPVVNFTPSSEANTVLLITPVDAPAMPAAKASEPTPPPNGTGTTPPPDGGPTQPPVTTPPTGTTGMLGQGGGDIANWDSLKATIGFKDVFDRYGQPVTGTMSRDITCVGALTVNGDAEKGLLSSAAQAKLNNGGYGLLSITNGRAIVYRLEYGLGKTLNGKTVGRYNQAWKM